MNFKHVKSLFSKTASSKRLTIVVTSSLVFVATLGLITYETTKKTVAMTLDGKEKIIRTHSETVGNILEELDIELHSKDYLSLPVETAVKDKLSFVWEPAKQVHLSIDGKQRSVWTTEDTVKDLLKDENIEIGSHDQIRPKLDENISENMKIDISKAFSLTLNDGGKKKKVWSTSTTVADFLKQQGIKLEDLDRTKPDLDKKVSPEDIIKVIRVKKVSDVVEEPVEYAVQTRKDADLLKGQEKIIQHGQNGLVRKEYEVTKENGKEVSRKLINEKTLKESKEKIVNVGTKVVTAQVSRGESEAGGTEYYVSSTAYTANCNGCSGQTATGINLHSNPNLKIIAVDPNFIPLGTKVYVEGYGYAVAADTGGAIKGRKIDVFFNNNSQAYRWGRKQVKIRILN
ncbi:ubiquitin-like domain-containing protein [Heyndrickxia sp. FSL W8-0423]|uniref:ubiquitin-like domain-containing protein n=1 Tax=Heyndrickxia sp. FSL W8-0423 TaxID=2921601 RepID=UPI0030F54D66